MMYITNKLHKFTIHYNWNGLKRHFYEHPKEFDNMFVTALQSH